MNLISICKEHYLRKSDNGNNHFNISILIATFAENFVQISTNFDNVTSQIPEKITFMVIKSSIRSY